MKQLFNKRWFKILSNFYVLITFIFILWMLFLDTNSWLIHRRLNKEIKQLENQKTQLEKEIASDKQTLKELSDPASLERYAREKHFMTKENEDLFLIEFQDSVKVQKE